MQPSTLHSHTEAFDERNNFLYFVLGLISLSRNLIHLFEKETQPDPETTPEPGEPPTENNPIDLRDLLR